MRFHPAIVALVACLSLLASDAAQAAVAPPGNIQVSRRVDPSLDPYMRTELTSTPLAAMTADQGWISAHARPLVVHDSDPVVSLNLVGWATKPNVVVYMNTTGVNPFHPQQMAEVKDWLVYKGGQPVFVDGWRMIDLRIPAARQWWLYGSDGKATCNPDRDLRSALDLLACGYHGLWLDNALTTPLQGFTPTPDIDEKTWAAGMLTLLGQLRALKPAGTTFTINTHWTDTDFGYAKKPRLKATEPAMRAARLADQVIIEGGAIDPGLNYAFAEKVQWSYRRLLTFADAFHRLKVKLQWEKTGSSDLTLRSTPVKGAPKLPAIPSCRDTDLAKPWVLGDASWKAHVRTAAFNYATALLTYATGDSVGDMCEYPGRTWRGYEANLGKPAGKRFEKNGLVIRKFKAGIVAVNPGDKPITFRIGRSGVDLGSLAYPVSNKAVKAVKLPARSAAVVEY